jgi:hypothetical protein
MLDIGRHPEFKTADGKPEVEITFGKKRWRRDSNGSPNIFGHTRFRYISVDMARRCPTIEINGGGHQTGNENNF